MFSGYLIPLKVWVYNDIYYPLRCCYERRWTRYTRTGKVALCCIAKMENAYIRFFAEYYKRLNFDKIFIYDNNEPDGERFDDVINDYIQSGFVEIVDFRGKKVAQLEAYQHCYDTQNKKYNWIAFFDCDEFLTFSNKKMDIHSFLGNVKFIRFQMIHLNWKVYGDNGLLDNDGRNVVERFKEPILPYDFSAQYNDVRENCHVKSIVRGGLSSILWNETPHTPVNKIYHCCNSVGKKVDFNSPFQDIDYTKAFIRHYSTKTIGEWIKNKMKRGFPDRSDQDWKDHLNLDFFYRYNTFTEEKNCYAKQLMEELAKKE